MIYPSVFRVKFDKKKTRKNIISVFSPLNYLKFETNCCMEISRISNHLSDHCQKDHEIINESKNKKFGPASVPVTISKSDMIKLCYKKFCSPRGEVWKESFFLTDDVRKG